MTAGAEGHYAKLWQSDADALWYFSIHDKDNHEQVSRGEGYLREASAIETIQDMFPGIEIRPA